MNCPRDGRLPSLVRPTRQRCKQNDNRSQALCALFRVCHRRYQPTLSPVSSRPCASSSSSLWLVSALASQSLIYVFLHPLASHRDLFLSLRRHEARVKNDRGNLPLHSAASFRAPLEVTGKSSWTQSLPLLRLPLFGCVDLCMLPACPPAVLPCS